MEEASDAKPERPVDRLSTTQWLAVYLAAWLVMLAAILALDTISADRTFVILTMAIWLLAFPVSFFLRRLPLTRAALNIPIILLCFVLAIPLIAGRLGLHIASGGVGKALISLSDTGALEFLIRFFVWIMVFRAFTLRTHRDLTLCTVPSISALVLTAILNPDIGMLIFFGVVLLGAMYLLDADHRVMTTVRADFVAAADGPAADVGPAPRSAWLGIYAGTLLCGAVLCIFLTRITVVTDVTRSLKLEAARRLADLITGGGNVPYGRGGVPGSIYMRRPAPQLSDTVMFRVRASRPANWRLTAYDVFRGSAWEQSNRLVRPLTPTGDEDFQLPPPPPRPGRSTEPPPLFLVGARVEIDQEITLSQTFQGPVVGAYQPVRYQGPGRSFRCDSYGGFLTSSILRRGTTYTVTSRVPILLHVPDDIASAPVPSDIANGPCMQLPLDTPVSVVLLARALADKQRTPYANALTIEQYLSDNYTYDDKVGATPRRRDPVEHFLFELKRGYCLQFASAMVVLCRAAGIPARLAVGYTQGEFEVETDEYVVRERNTHAWPEVYLNALGWVAFDPTSMAAETQLTGTALMYENAALWWQGIVQRVPLLADETARRVATFVLVALAAIAGGVWSICRYRKGIPMTPLTTQFNDEASKRLTRAYWAMCGGAARRGLRREPAQTAFEFSDAVSSAVPDARESVRWLTRTYAGMVFGERRPSGRIVRLAEARSSRALRLLREADLKPHATGADGPTRPAGH